MTTRLNDKQQRAYDRWQSAHGHALRIAAQHALANGGFGTHTAHAAGQEIQAATSPELDEAVVPEPLLELYMVRKLERAAASLAIMRGIPSKVLLDRAVELVDMIRGEYT